MIETEPTLGVAGSVRRGRIKRPHDGAVSDSELEQREALQADELAVEWRDGEYFSGGRSEFCEIASDSALEQMMVGGADPTEVRERLEHLKKETGAPEALLELETLYFQMAKEGSNAGAGILLARALQEILSHNIDEKITFRTIWHEICLMRSVRIVQALIRKGDARMKGLTFPLDTDAKMELFDQLVEGCTHQVEKQDGGFEQFKFRCMGAVAEYAGGAALHEVGEAASDQVKVYYPAGKELNSVDPHIEEGAGVDWVVTLQTDSSDRRVLLVQVKSFAFADQGWVYRPIRSAQELTKALDDLKARQLVFRNEAQRTEEMTDLIGDVRRSMLKLLEHATHGEVPVLCILPSLPINADTDRNAAYYSARTGAPQPGLKAEAAKLLASQGITIDR